jgi:calcium binding protein 39
MTFWFTKKSRKGLAKKLRICLEDIQMGIKKKKLNELYSIILSINETLNQEEFNRDDLPHILNGKLYRDETIANLISFMPFFDSNTLNALSTFFQTTIRKFPDESLPQYIMARRETLNLFLKYFEQENVSSVSHSIIRACTINAEFVNHMFKLGVVGSFVKFLTSEDFDRNSTAFATYEALLMSHPEISVRYFNDKWAIFAIQFKQLMASPNYLVQLNFLPIVFRFVTSENCQTVLYNFINDNENLQSIMILLRNNSKKMQKHAYSIFKLFVLNPRMIAQIRDTLKMNKAKLINFLEEFKIEDSDKDLEDEKQHVIEIIHRL